MSRIRVGIVGCGGIARGTHVPYYRKMNDVEVVACADVDIEAARSLADDFKIPRYYT
ncbi:MAG: Gfo/Idh/MocA family oxidoreductase, partial [Thermoproteota archaeon]